MRSNSFGAYFSSQDLAISEGKVGVVAIHFLDSRGSFAQNDGQMLCIYVFLKNSM